MQNGWWYRSSFPFPPSSYLCRLWGENSCIWNICWKLWRCTGPIQSWWICRCCEPAIWIIVFCFSTSSWTVCEYADYIDNINTYIYMEEIIQQCCVIAPFFLYLEKLPLQSWGLGRTSKIKLHLRIKEPISLKKNLNEFQREMRSKKHNPLFI